jgi:uncharacterized protein (TIGR02145 family)
MKKLFFLLAVIACSLLSYAQTNLVVWNNGRVQFAQPIASIDSLTFTGKVAESDTLHLILPRSTQQEVQDPTTVTPTSAQTNQVVWNNGRIQFATPFANIDSLTYTGDVTQSDTMHLLLLRSAQFYIHDTVIKTVTVIQHDTVYIHDCDFTPEGVLAVDLGLPSGIKWASCNVGAVSPEEYGNYYAWGEVTTKDTCSWSTYKYANGSSNTLTKYCNDSTYGNNGLKDNKKTLGVEDDAAHENWSEAWRMPTDAEWTELRTNCTWTWTTQNNVNGYLVKSNTNSNSIFLPAAGYRKNTALSRVGTYGYFWSASLDTSDPSTAWTVYFYSGTQHRRGTNRCYGYSIRPVCQ